MRSRASFIALLLAAPVAILFAAERFAPRTRPALLIGMAASLAAALVAHHLLCSDPADKESALAFAVYLPLVLAPVAGIVASLVIGSGARWWAAVGAALLGAAAGELVELPLIAIGAPCYRIVLVAAPVVFASCAAVVAAGLRTPRS